MMRTITRGLLGLGLACLALGAARADEPAKAVAPKAADGDAPLAEGFPGATEPGKIEVKTYPAYRGAVAAGKEMSRAMGDSLFFALFGHIQRNGVEMTAPVINTYVTPGLIERPDARGELTMEFVYPNARKGQAGRDNALVEVVDHPAATYVCLGLQGEMTGKRAGEGVAQLRAWLAEHKEQWIEDGPPRRLGYHGPMTPVAERLWEVQVPVKPAR